jgi:hypothetical protein
MLSKSSSIRCALLIGALLVGACSSNPQIKYSASNPASAVAKTTVGLKVNDLRAADKGGTEHARVGQVRSGFGIPSGLDDASPDVAPRTVTEATSDALRGAGIGVQAGGGKVLAASIKEFWMDGYMGYAASVVINYQLLDPSGKELWAAEVKGGAGGTPMFKSAKSLTEDLFQQALGELATKAGEQFRSAAFQQALGK